jgi:hypothetical protein
VFIDGQTLSGGVIGFLTLVIDVYLEPTLPFPSK